MATFGQSKFTAANGTLLTAYTTDTGVTFAAHPNSGGGIYEITNNRLEYSGTGNAIFLASTIPDSADYSVFGDFHRVAAGSGTKLLARFDDTALSGYFAFYYESQGTWAIGRYGNDTLTILVESVADTITAGTSKRLEFRLSGSTLTLHVDGTQVASTTDSTYQDAGRVGFRGFQAEEIHLDNWVVATSDVYMADSFAGPNEPLANHTPDVGGAWTNIGATASDPRVDTNRVLSSSGSERFVPLSPETPPTPDQVGEVDVLFNTVNVDNKGGVMLRYNGTDVGYVWYYRGDSAFVSMYNGSTLASLPDKTGTHGTAAAPVAGTWYRMRLEIYNRSDGDVQILGYIDGVKEADFIQTGTSTGANKLAGTSGLFLENSTGSDVVELDEPVFYELKRIGITSAPASAASGELNVQIGVESASAVTTVTYGGVDISASIVEVDSTTISVDFPIYYDNGLDFKAHVFEISDGAVTDSVNIALTLPTAVDYYRTVSGYPPAGDEITFFDDASITAVDGDKFTIRDPSAIVLNVFNYGGFDADTLVDVFVRHLDISDTTDGPDGTWTNELTFSATSIDHLVDIGGIAQASTATITFDNAGSFFFTAEIQAQEATGDADFLVSGSNTVDANSQAQAATATLTLEMSQQMFAQVQAQAATAPFTLFSQSREINMDVTAQAASAGMKFRVPITWTFEPDNFSGS